MHHKIGADNQLIDVDLMYIYIYILQNIPRQKMNGYTKYKFKQHYFCDGNSAFQRNENDIKFTD